ncbi:uncharacterized protein LOC120278009 [Dioscorea cayenensis subsp. rotundata]|uniref:Uncharacterized protein LOC120278009 n=1 Tax=Dioscorea cayennensis subsp. rotundata TaxID=55577 RepID=A0AB40CN94_DIOCR|nr:uncharacterized protein LOC120278009 [Dioscorea cayenensis subsp. rotundata]
MDPCPFVRVLVGNLALKLPVAARPARAGVHPSASPCYCRIRLNKLPYQTAPLPLDSGETPSNSLSASFDLSRADLDRLAGKSIFAGGARIKIAIYTGRRGTTCGVSSGRLLGKITVPLDLKSAEDRSCIFHTGWVSVGKGSKSSVSAQLHLTVKSEPDPRFVFEFDGEPECSPLVYQLQGSMRQPMFSCKFSCRSAADRCLRSRSVQIEGNNSKGWLSTFGSERERPVKERKGWSVTVHDLSGSPVAMASMVTPFVASPGTDRVSRSNPGAWLILRPGDGTWKPWGRLEAWRERGGIIDGIGYRFELLPDTTSPSGAGVLLAESTLSASKGGRFSIDLTSTTKPFSPVTSPRGSGDFGHGLWPFSGFVMSSTVEGEGKQSRPTVEVGVAHVACAEDAAAFVALAAAVDLSLDACRLFSHRLRKELEFSE